MTTISTHVLDTAVGRPAPGIAVALERDSGEPLGVATTDADGRVRALLADGAALAPGTYRLRFAVGAYLDAAGRDGFYPEVVVAFRVRAGDEHLHVPLLLSPFGYATYRGS